MGNVATSHANRMNLGDKFRTGHQSGYRAKGNSPEIHVKASNNDSYTHVSQFVAYFQQVLVKKLGFINSNHINIPGKQQNGGGVVDGSGAYGVFIVGYHFGGRIPGVYRGFKDFNPLSGNFCATQTTDQLLCFS